VHFPTDLNLLWDAGRKWVDLIEKYRTDYGLAGGRKVKDGRRRLKGLERRASRTAFGGGKDKDKRLRVVVEACLQVARELSAKVTASILELYGQEVQKDALEYFEARLDKHIDRVDRRLLRGERIPSGEKVYSLFEPHTEWDQPRQNPIRRWNWATGCW